MKTIKQQFKNYSLSNTRFTPCITDGTWFVSRWDVTHTNTNKKASYVFGIDGVEATIYNQNNPDFRIDDLAYDALIRHLEKTPENFNVGFFRFEFDGQKFNYCDKKPKWADYDCGIL